MNEVKMGLGSRFRCEHNKHNDEIEIKGSFGSVEEQKVDNFDDERLDKDFLRESVQTSDRGISVLDDNILSYLKDKDVIKVVIIDNQLKIFRKNGLIESVSVPIEYEKNFKSNSSGVFRYVEKGYLISGVRPPVSQKSCMTIKKIELLTPDEFLMRSSMPKKTFDFISKAVATRKNILIVDDSLLLNTILNFILADSANVLLREIEKLNSNSFTTTFNVERLFDKEFIDAITVALDVGAEYVIADLESEYKMANLLSFSHDINGKIYSVSARNAQMALFKVINLIMSAEHCNEKIAKSTLLHSFDYIVAQNKVYVITPAKTAIITLKSLPE